MEENFFAGEGMGMGMQGSELNSRTGQLQDCFLNPNWDNSMDLNDPFESAISSMVSSPANSNAGEHVVLGELIGKLGSICNSGEINNSTNNSCYSTPLNSPPKLNLSIMDHQIRGNSPFLNTHNPNLAQFPVDPAFAERAARFSCFSSRVGMNSSSFPHNFAPELEPVHLSRVSSSHCIKNSGSQLGVQGNRGADNFAEKNAEMCDSRENSSVSEQHQGGKIVMNSQNDVNRRKRKSQRGKPREMTSSVSNSDDAKAVSENTETNAKRSKLEGSANVKDAAKPKPETNGTENNNKSAEDGKNEENKDNSKPAEAPKDYIHVRARRGQATDPHSLAERVRREKISERMKLLQELVPGCNKVTGKAVMLDEIINYVQSLQRQVEFLSMKLAAIKPRMDINVEALLSKDSRGFLPPGIYLSDAPPSSSAFPYTFQPQSGMDLHSVLLKGADVPFSMNHLNVGLATLQSSVENFLEAAPKAPAFSEDDLQSIVNMGASHNQK